MVGEAVTILLLDSKCFNEVLYEFILQPLCLTHTPKVIHPVLPAFSRFEF